MAQSAKTIDNYSAETRQDDAQGHNSIDPIEKYRINGCTPINAVELAEIETTTEYKGFVKGQSGNPKGRPKGSLNKISSLFYDDLYNDWRDHGNQAIEQMRIESNTKYCQLVASILPKSLQVETDGVRWVINAQPGLTTDDWLREHNLIDQDSE